MAKTPNLFIDLQDTPTTFTAQAGKVVAVNSTPDALEFVDLTDALAIHTTTNDEINQLTLKGTPEAADVLIIEDNTGSTWDKKKITLTDLLGIGSETNDLAGDGIANIVDDQIAIGSGPGTAAYHTLPEGAVSYTLGTNTVAQAALADLSDVTATEGTGSTIVFTGSPTIVTPTIASFTNSAHDHSDAAGGGTLGTGSQAPGVVATQANAGVFSFNDTGVSTFLSAGPANNYLKSNGTGTAMSWDVPGGSGDVLGPATNTNNTLARWDGVDSKTLQDTGIAVSDTTYDITGAGNFNGVTVEDHSALHQDGGADEISVANLSGLLADAQTPLGHAYSVHTDTVPSTDFSNNTIAPARIETQADSGVLIFNATGVPAYLGPGNDGQVLTSAGTGVIPAWEDAVGAEVNNLATDGIAGIVDDQIAIGSGEGTAAYKTLPGGAVSYTLGTNTLAQAALADLSDVTATTGTGSTLVFDTSPTIATPTIASFANSAHDHSDAAGGGALGTGSQQLEIIADEANAGVASFNATGVAAFLSAGGSGTYLKSNGTGSLLTWDTPTVTEVNNLATTTGIVDDQIVIGSGTDTAAYHTLPEGAVSYTLGTNTLSQAALANLSDVTATEGTGSTILFQGSPNITTPTISSFTNSAHDHSDAAGGGSIANNSQAPAIISTQADSGAYIFNATGVPAYLGPGNDGDVLTSGGTGVIPSWSAAGGIVRDHEVATANTAIAANTTITATNTDGTLLAHTAASFVADLEIYINGKLMRNGATSGANFDVYPAGTDSSGEFACEFPLVSGDTIQMFKAGTFSANTDASAFHDDQANEISALGTETAAAGDWILIEDASASFVKKKVNASDFLGGGPEVNDLATDGIDGIVDNQLAVGTGVGTAEYQTLTTGAVKFDTSTGAFTQAASSDLSDIATKTGTGTEVVMSGSPEIVTPTIASFASSTHDHSDAAGGGALGTGSQQLEIIADEANAGVASFTDVGAATFLSAGGSGTYLKSNGTGTAMSWDTPPDGDVSSNGTTSLAGELPAYTDTGQKEIGRSDIKVGTGTAAVGTRTISGGGALAGGTIATDGTIAATGSGAVAVGYASKATGIEASITSSQFGSFAYGSVLTTIGGAADSQIASSGFGTFAGGYVSTVSSAGLIQATAAGAFAHGANNQGGTIQAQSSGSLAAGYTTTEGTVEVLVGCDGAFVHGYAASSAIIRATTAPGSFATGYCSGSGSSIIVEGLGAFASGACISAGTITSGSNGSFCGGAAIGNDISASAQGSFAWGNAQSGDITASAINAVQFGLGVNNQAASLQVGDTTDGIRLTAGGAAPTDTLHNGDIWVQGSDVSVRTSGATVAFSELGDVFGPGASVVDQSVAVFNGTGGLTIEEGSVRIATTDSIGTRTISSSGMMAGAMFTTGGTVSATAKGAVALGNVVQTAGTALLTATGSGAFALGEVDCTAAGTGTLKATGDGSFAIGRVEVAGVVTTTIQALAPGSLAGGYATSGSTIETETATKGSIAFGYATGGGIIETTTAEGCFAGGHASGTGNDITASQAGAFAYGRCGSGASITASGLGALAFGYSISSDIIASSTNSFQFAAGTNNQASSLQVGDTTDGIRLNANGAPTTAHNGDIWVDGSGDVNIASSGSGTTSPVILNLPDITGSRGSNAALASLLTALAAMNLITDSST